MVDLWPPARQLTARAPIQSSCEKCHFQLLKDLLCCRQIVEPSTSHLVALIIVRRNNSSSTRCEFCRFLSAVLSPELARNESSIGLQLRAFRTWRRHRPEDFAAALLFGLGSSLLVGEDLIRRDCLSRGLISPVAGKRCNGKTRRTRSFQGSRVLPSKINYARLQNWILECDNKHVVSCVSVRNESTHKLKLIDCQTREMVVSDANDSSRPYFALSWKWPQQDNVIESHEQIDNSLPFFRLPEKIPRVVEDAIEAVKKLSGRYLWVDKFCINQHDPEDVGAQIRQMDIIFERAEAALMAITDPCSPSRLYGMSDVPRNEQPSTCVDGTTLVWTMPPLSSVLEYSSWNTRAWTYQEAALSRRCLFFTKYQVYFVCRAMTRCEAFKSKLIEPDPPQELESVKPEQPVQPRLQHYTQELVMGNMGMNSRIFGGTDTNNAYMQFANHLRNYTNRKLTYEEDALNAVRGMLARSPFLTLWGVPLRGDVNETLVLDLAWQAAPNESNPNTVNSLRRPLWRRRGFPSWSWVGWTGQIEYEFLDILDASSTNKSETLDLESSSLTGRYLEDLWGWAMVNPSRILPECDMFLSIDAGLVAQMILYKSTDNIYCISSSKDPTSETSILTPFHSPDDAMYLTLEAKGALACDGLLLSWVDGARWGESAWFAVVMILRWHPSTEGPPHAERAGLIVLPKEVFNELAKTRQSFRLG